MYFHQLILLKITINKLNGWYYIQNFAGFVCDNRCTLWQKRSVRIIYLCGYKVKQFNGMEAVCHTFHTIQMPDTKIPNYTNLISFIKLQWISYYTNFFHDFIEDRKQADAENEDTKSLLTRSNNFTKLSTCMCMRMWVWVCTHMQFHKSYATGLHIGVIHL